MSAEQFEAHQQHIREAVDSLSDTPEAAEKLEHKKIVGTFSTIKDKVDNFKNWYQTKGKDLQLRDKERAAVLLKHLDTILHQDSKAHEIQQGYVQLRKAFEEGKVVDRSQSRLEDLRQGVEATKGATTNIDRKLQTLEKRQRELEASQIDIEKDLQQIQLNEAADVRSKWNEQYRGETITFQGTLDASFNTMWTKNILPLLQGIISQKDVSDLKEMARLNIVTNVAHKNSFYEAGLKAFLTERHLGEKIAVLAAMVKRIREYTTDKVDLITVLGKYNQMIDGDMMNGKNISRQGYAKFLLFHTQSNIESIADKMVEHYRNASLQKENAQSIETNKELAKGLALNPEKIVSDQIFRGTVQQGDDLETVVRRLVQERVSLSEDAVAAVTSLIIEKNKSQKFELKENDEIVIRKGQIENASDKEQEAKQEAVKKVKQLKKVAEGEEVAEQAPLSGFAGIALTISKILDSFFPKSGWGKWIRKMFKIPEPGATVVAESAPAAKLALSALLMESPKNTVYQFLSRFKGNEKDLSQGKLVEDWTAYARKLAKSPQAQAWAEFAIGQKLEYGFTPKDLDVAQTKLSKQQGKTDLLSSLAKRFEVWKKTQQGKKINLSEFLANL